MAKQQAQETTEYYQWLIRTEQQEFEAQLLSIVSIHAKNSFPVLMKHPVTNILQFMICSDQTSN